LCSTISGSGSGSESGIPRPSRCGDFAIARVEEGWVAGQQQQEMQKYGYWKWVVALLLGTSSRDGGVMMVATDFCFLVRETVATSNGAGTAKDWRAATGKVALALNLRCRLHSGDPSALPHHKIRANGTRQTSPSSGAAEVSKHSIQPERGNRLPCATENPHRCFSLVFATLTPEHRVRGGLPLFWVPRLHSKS